MPLAYTAVMPGYVAFLRAINVGGHVVKMPDLRRLFESIGFTGVETFIQSGNVVFEAPNTKARELEGVIEQCLEQALGYPVATFLRTTRELATVAKQQPFDAADSANGATVYVAFLCE